MIPLCVNPKDHNKRGEFTDEALLSKQKRPQKRSFLLNGATNGIRLEKYCVEFAQMCLQETELIEQIYRFYMSIKNC